TRPWRKRAPSTAIRGLAVMIVGALLLAACNPPDYGANDHFDVREPGGFAAWVERHQPGTKAFYSNGVLELEAERTTTEGLVWAASNETDLLLIAMRTAAAHGEDLRTIVMTYSGEMVGQYYKSVGMKQIAAVTFDVPECLKFDHPKWNPFELAECATVK